MLKMKITMYELLGLVKDGKAPKKIKYDGDIYFLESDAIFEFFTYKTIDYNKFNTDGERLGKALFLDNRYMHLYSEVEILDEPKKIEKIARCDDVKMTHNGELYKPTENEEILRIKVNELIDEVNKLKEK